MDDKLVFWLRMDIAQDHLSALIFGKLMRSRNLYLYTHPHTLCVQFLQASTHMPFSVWVLMRREFLPSTTFSSTQ